MPWLVGALVVWQARYLANNWQLDNQQMLALFFVAVALPMLLCLWLSVHAALAASGSAEAVFNAAAFALAWRVATAVELESGRAGDRLATAESARSGDVGRGSGGRVAMAGDTACFISGAAAHAAVSGRGFYQCDCVAGARHCTVVKATLAV